MLQAMLSGVASIKAHQTRLNAIGNNIANVNTTAFKSQRVGFQEMLSQTVRSASRPNESIGGINPFQVGLGVRVSSSDTIQDQGSLQATNRSTDFAIQGQGYFMVSNGSEVMYTRDGAFDIDSNGVVVHRGTGQKLMGWTADLNGDFNTSDQVGELTIPLGSLTSVQQTTRAPFAGNLDSRSASSATRTVKTIVFDSLGGEHEVTVTFTNHQTGSFTAPGGATATGRWDWTATENGVTVGSSSAGPPDTRLYFDSSGKIDPNNLSQMKIDLTPTNGAQPFSVSLDFAALQQVEESTNVQASQANGFRPGTLSQFSVGLDGIINGTFTNGFSRPIGRIALALFANPGGLERVGNNLVRQSSNSGLPSIGAPTEGGRAEVNVGFLEQSNVDIGDQFTTMIITQRGFQANTRVVTTVDEMMQDILNMKR